MTTLRGPDWAKTIVELRDLSDEELIAQHDELVGPGEGRGVAIGIRYYLEELSRRRTERSERRMLLLTWVIAGLTLVNVAAVLYGAL